MCGCVWCVCAMCVVCCVCGVVCGVWCVVCVRCVSVCGAAWPAEPPPPVCRFKTSPRVRSKTLPCVPAKRAHVFNMRACYRYTRKRFERTHGDVLNHTRGFFFSLLSFSLSFSPSLFLSFSLLSFLLPPSLSFFFLLLSSHSFSLPFNPHLTSQFFSSLLCSLLSALCSLLSALCSLLSAFSLFSLLSSLFSLLSSLFSLLFSSLFSSSLHKHEWAWREGEDAVLPKKPLTFHNVSFFFLLAAVSSTFSHFESRQHARSRKKDTLWKVNGTTTITCDLLRVLLLCVCDVVFCCVWESMWCGL